MLSLLALIELLAFPVRSDLPNLHWRMIGPFRGGRTVAVCGVPSRPNLFYMAPNNGGVWKTTDAGRTWKPLFDNQPTGSVGALAVSPSNPDILYVGSGEGLQRPDLSTGNGIYRSGDGGATWTHLGLRDGLQIPAIAVDPRDPNRLLVAVLGHPYGPNPERGIYRSEDGGQSFQRVLFTNENTGATEVVFDPRNPDIVYGVLYSGRLPPWETPGSWDGPGSGLYKSIDGGSTWNRLTGGIPAEPGRIGIAIAPSDPTRIYAQVDGKEAGTYRSDDAGMSWRRVNKQPRIFGRGSDFAEIRVHPTNPDIVFVANTSTYRSTDGGKSFEAIKGAPGGDDYHRIWIDPNSPDTMILGSDQGAVITVNGGTTWSSWYNQPTAQFYHVSTDSRFPYWVYGGQQESGSAGVASRGDYGAITHNDWRTVGVEEYGYAVPDPLNPDLIYGGKITRTNLRTGDVQDISPEPIRSGKLRYVRTLPIAFSPVDKHALYFAANVVFKSRNGGRSWMQISPDLTRASYPVPRNVGIFASLDSEKGKHRGVVYALAPSHQDPAGLWAGTDDGLIQRTTDGGKTWKNVTPAALTPWSKLSILDAGHFDSKTAYAAINRIRLDDQRPHILRTHDGGVTWKEITQGIPADEVVNVVREDPQRKGLLFCGTERAVYFSLDDGESWTSLRLDMCASSIRDLVIHGDDLVAATHGRSFWILDDITPLRQWTTSVISKPSHLFRPQAAYRVSRSRNTDTPLPPDEPMGENPPDGAVIDYWLDSAPSAPIMLDVIDSGGNLVRRYTSADREPSVNPDDLDVPMYWVRPPRVLPATAGMHRWVWDCRYTPPALEPGGFPISAIPHDTPRDPLGPLAAPGQYSIRLTAGGRTSTQPLRLILDPRIHISAQGLAARQSLALRLYEGINSASAAVTRIAAIRKSKPPKELDSELAALAGQQSGRPRRGTLNPTNSLSVVRGSLAGLLGAVDGTDEPPTTQIARASHDELAKLRRLQDTLSRLLRTANGQEAERQKPAR